MYRLSARKIDKIISKLMYTQCERQKYLASYITLMKGLLRSTCSIGKTFFFIKNGDKQRGLRSLASFTSAGPDAYIYYWGNTVIPLAS